MEAGRAISMLSSSSSLSPQLAHSSSSSPSASSSCCALGSSGKSLSCVKNGNGSNRSRLLQTENGHSSFAVMASAPSESAMTVTSSNNSPTTSAQTSPASAIDFLMICQRLKTTKRTGWVNHGLKETESISDHMHRMAVMAIIAADVPGVDINKCVKMAVVHDIAEAIVGDITPSCGIPKEEKSKRELAAIDEMCSVLGGGVAAEEVKNLWLEYENNSSVEANLVKDFDKVEMILQALEYETAQGKTLNDFYESTAGKFQTDTGKAWAAEIVKRRQERINSLKQ